MQRQLSIRSWLSIRIRVLCIGIFAVSLFVRPYVSESSGELPDIETDYSQFLLAEDGFLMKTSSLTEQGTRSAFAKGTIHTVERGETVASIAKLYDINADTVRYANALSEKATLKPGQTLLILPVNGIIHTVKRGQNLSAIADLYNVPVDAISTQNQIQGGYLLAGQELIIPGGKPIVEPVRVIAKKPPQSTISGVKPVAVVAQAVMTDVPTGGILQRPCICFMTQNYSGHHYGLDLQQRGGGPIFAAEAGTVIRADYGWNGGYGNVIEIDHGNGIITLYGHNKSFLVAEGDTVSRGQQIAAMGNTGLVHGPTGIHLHFEVMVKGVKKNPNLYLQE